MAKQLGKRTQTGRLTTANPYLAGGWAVTFDPTIFGIRVPFEIFHIAVRGPAYSSFQVFQDTTFYDIVSRGDINSWDPSQPMVCDPGMTVFFYFNSTSTPAPVISVFCRETSPI